jgi:hypothetical protein
MNCLGERRGGRFASRNGRYAPLDDAPGIYVTEA